MYIKKMCSNFSLDLKVDTPKQFFIFKGSLFHISGAATEKDLAP